MRKVVVNRSRVGSRVARDICTLDGMVLLADGAELTEEMIDKLKQHGITEVFVDDDYSRNIPVAEPIREEIITEVKSQIKNMMTSPSIKISADGKKALEIVERLICNILNSDNIIISLSDIRSVDDYTYSHSVNVCILSLITGIAMGIKGDSLKDLGVGALLHDVGKVMISKKILLKPTSLTFKEIEEVKLHTVHGYEIMQRSGNIGSTAQAIAISHHERCDGSGYPYQLKHDEIPLPARIVAVADVFDALTTDRVYRKKMLHHEVIDYMCSLSNRHFDKNVLDNFIRHVAYYPVGTAILLNTGEKGLVSRYNYDYPVRPVVRVVIDENGKMLYKHKEIDLSKKIEYRITDIWDI